MTPINLNLTWSTIFVEQLQALGVKYVCIASGSRSTPLTLAFSSHPNVVAFSHVDERSAAFFALGLAKITETPVAVVSTSGTAASNFFPAIIEAKESHIPLIICSADRPHELRVSGANQTMDQIKLFGDHVNWFQDVAIPQPMTAKLVRYLQHLAVRSFQESMYPLKGPVHLNFPFRKPLEPTEQESQTLAPSAILSSLPVDYKSIIVELGHPVIQNHALILQQLQDAKRVMIICGPDSYRQVGWSALSAFSDNHPSLLVVDALSGLRYTGDEKRSNMITTYETFLQQDLGLESPDLILLIGEMPISKYLMEFLSMYRGEFVTISTKQKLTDATLRSTKVIKALPASLFDALGTLKAGLVDQHWIDTWVKIDQITRDLLGAALENYPGFEPALLNYVLDRLDRSQLVAANSLIVRHLDQFYHSRGSGHAVISNRGVSGIDGTVSTALGASIESSIDVVLLIGDLAFYHDMNGLLALRRYQLPLKIIVVNNHGGAIFDRLPIATFNPPFEEFLINKHDLSFEAIASFYNMSYYCVKTRDELDRVLPKFIQSQQVILEIDAQYKTVEKIRDKITAEILSELI